MTPHEDCTALLLAGGEGRRFGSNKLLRAKVNGQALGLVTASIYSAIMPTVVVVRAEDKATASMFNDNGFTIVEAELASEGMGHTIAAGVSYLENTSAQACLIGLADMPFVASSTLIALRDCLVAGVAMVRPCHAGAVGNPVGFRREYFPALVELRGDSGARELLKNSARHVHLVNVDDPGVLQDIDTPADLTSHQ